MKNLLSIILISLSMFLVACEGSESYRGDWKAVNGEGTKMDIHFTGTEMSFSGDSIDPVTWEYTQNTISLENGRSEYGIQLRNGFNYTIIFPIPNNEEKGAIVDENGRILYIIGRTDYYNYEDVFAPGQ